MTGEEVNLVMLLVFEFNIYTEINLDN